MNGQGNIQYNQNYRNQIDQLGGAYQGCQPAALARKDEHVALKAEVASLKEQLAKLNASLVEFLLRQK